MRPKSFVIFFGCAIIATSVFGILQIANAEPASKATAVEDLSGTFLVKIATEGRKINDKVLKEPKVIKFGAEEFLAGTATSGIEGREIVDEVFEGRKVLIPMTRILVIQQVSP